MSWFDMLLRIIVIAVFSIAGWMGRHDVGAIYVVACYAAAIRFAFDLIPGGADWD